MTLGGPASQGKGKSGKIDDQVLLGILTKAENGVLHLQEAFTKLYPKVIIIFASFTLITLKNLNEEARNYVKNTKTLDHFSDVDLYALEQREGLTIIGKKNLDLIGLGDLLE